MVNVIDEIINGSPKYNITDNVDGTKNITLANEVMQQGTPLNKAIFKDINNVAYEIYDNFEIEETTATLDKALLVFDNPESSNSFWTNGGTTPATTGITGSAEWGDYKIWSNEFASLGNNTGGNRDNIWMFYWRLNDISRYGLNYFNNFFETTKETYNNKTFLGTQYYISSSSQSSYKKLYFDFDLREQKTCKFNIRLGMFEYPSYVELKLLTSNNGNDYSLIHTFVADDVNKDLEYPINNSRYVRLEFRYIYNYYASISFNYMYFSNMPATRIVNKFYSNNITNMPRHNQKVSIDMSGEYFDNTNVINTKYNDRDVDTLLEHNKKYEMYYDTSQNKFIAQEAWN